MTSSARPPPIRRGRRALPPPRQRPSMAAIVAFGIVRKRSTIAVNNGSSFGGCRGSDGSCRINLTSAWAMKKSGFALSTTTTRPGHARVASEHAEHPVLPTVHPMLAQGGVHGVAERLPGLVQEKAAVALDSPVALADARNRHSLGNIRPLIRYLGP